MQTKISGGNKADMSDFFGINYKFRYKKIMIIIFSITNSLVLELFNNNTTTESN